MNSHKQPSLTDKHSSLSIQEAAAEVLALVNASPRTPRAEEIAAIIARAARPAALPAASTASPRPADFRARWDALKREGAAIEADQSTAGLPCGHSLAKAEEAHLADLVERQEALAKAAWATRARDPDDLVLLAEIAFLFSEGDLADFPTWHLGGDDYPRDHAVAHLVRGVVDVARAQGAGSEEGGTP